ncbi:MAG: carboxymuconolactone decarboxylase family protein, partial [Psychrobacillus psychrodurans]
YGGEKALQIGLQSFEYALELSGTPTEKISHDATAIEIIRYYAQFASSDDRKDYYEQLIILFMDDNENALTEKLLASNVVDEQMKYILMTGIYTTMLQNAETDYWANKAREKGVEEPQLAELGYICLLTAGIPSWFEISDALIEK